MDRRTRFARSAVRRLISEQSRFRGKAQLDGRTTLLTVDYRATNDVLRLISSWSRYCEGPIVVVENSGRQARRAIKEASPSTRVLGGLANLHHGLGLDYGLRFVTTEFVVICDPDSMILSPDFLPRMLAMIETGGVAGIVLHWPWYSPMCLAFPTTLWKQSSLSMQESPSKEFDVAGAVSKRFGGVLPGTVLQRTRNPEVVLSEPKVYGDVFTCAIGASRQFDGPAAFHEAEGDFDTIVRLQASWRKWADAYLAGDATLDDFTSWVAS